MKMSILNWIIAILGAAAWLPHIIGWIYKYFTKPKITILPEKIPQIGFSILGPIFNLRLSVGAKYKDAIIDFIGAKLYHESGSIHAFEWVEITQMFSQIKDISGVNQSVERSMAPIAIKVGTLSLEERFFRFNDSEFLKLAPQKIEASLKKIAYLQKQKNKEESTKDFLKSQECEEYLTWVKSRSYWQPGTYT